MRSLFHFAFHVRDLDAARRFYGGVLGCTEGRSAATWVDFDFFGHQLSVHLGEPFVSTNTGLVGEARVPMPHFGVGLELADWQTLAQRLREHATAFVLAPQCRFEGQPGEQWTMFFHDPSGNAIEVKGFSGRWRRSTPAEPPAARSPRTRSSRPGLSSPCGRCRRSA